MNEPELDLVALDQWYADHFEELVDQYGSKVIAVVDNKVVAVADTEKEAYQKAKADYPNAIPFVLAIPTEEELACLL